jgi:hypothetical protein
MTPKVVDVKAELIPEQAPAAPPAPQTPQAGPENAPRVSTGSLKETLRQVENIGQTLGAALQGRGNVVMVRVNDETLLKLDMLVEADITRSRSESAAYLINEGMRVNDALYKKIGEITDQIATLRAQLREAVKTEEK